MRDISACPSGWIWRFLCSMRHVTRMISLFFAISIRGNVMYGIFSPPRISVCQQRCLGRGSELLIRRSDPKIAAKLHNHSTARTLPPILARAMQTWRRTLATSAARLGYNNPPLATTPGPPALRCAQILQESRRNGPCSLQEQEIKVKGFIRSVRKQKRFAFAEISDGSTVEALQALLSPSQAAEYVHGQLFFPGKFAFT